MSGRIYLIGESDSLTPMDEAPYEAEAVLQVLLADHPDILAGEQMNPESPRRWVLVKREHGVPDVSGGTERWSLDHLFLDQDGVPTLVEVKRSSDTRIRREVLGQMLDYAANAVAYWPIEEIRSEFEERCENAGEDPESVILGLVGDLAGSTEDFWKTVQTNLRAGRIRMVFVADAIPRELQRIVEFLNEQLDPAEMLAVEVRQYVGGESRTLVPRVIGQTAEAQDRKTVSGPPRSWDRDSFIEDVAERRPGDEVEVAHDIMKWADEHGAVLKWGRGRVYGTFKVRLARAGVELPTFLVYSDGRVELAFPSIAQQTGFEQVERREELRQRLLAAGVDIPSDGVDRWPRTTLEVLSDRKVLDGFLDAWLWYADEVVKGEQDREGSGMSRHLEKGESLTENAVPVEARPRGRNHE